MNPLPGALRAPSLLCLAVALAFFASPLAAQQVTVNLPDSVDEILEALASPDGDRRNAGRMWVRAYVRGDPAPRALDRLVQGLVSLHASHPDVRVRRGAYASLSFWAQSDVARNDPSTVSTLVAAYESGPQKEVGSILTIMPELGPGVRGQAVGFLRRVATDEDSVSELRTMLAIEMLARMGEPGRAALRELHERRLVHTPWARQLLEDLSRNGFRPPGGERRPDA